MSEKLRMEFQKSMASKPTKGNLKKRLWLVFSAFIRKRDEKLGCISCGKHYDIKDMDAGHFIPKTAGLSIYFDERNCNAQCHTCNRWKHGNLSGYAIGLRKKYGNDILEELDRLRVQTRKISRMEYETLIEKYKIALVSLRNS